MSRCRKWCLANGWLVDTGLKAANKYDNPTRGSHDVRVLRAVDPRELRTSNSEVPESTNLAISTSNSEVQNLHLKISTSNFEDNGFKVLGSGSGSVSGYASHSTYGYKSGKSVQSVATLVNPSPAEQGENQEPTAKATATPNATPNATATPTATPTATTTATATATATAATTATPTPAPFPSKPPARKVKIKAAPDGTPYPAEFDSGTNVERCRWLESHKVVPVKETSAKPTPTPSWASPLPAESEPQATKPKTLADHLSLLPKLQPEPKPQPEQEVSVWDIVDDDSMYPPVPRKVATSNSAVEPEPPEVQPVPYHPVSVWDIIDNDPMDHPVRQKVASSNAATEDVWDDDLNRVRSEPEPEPEPSSWDDRNSDPLDSPPKKKISAPDDGLSAVERARESRAAYRAALEKEFQEEYGLV